MYSRIIQISDTHLLKNPHQKLKGVNTTNTVSSVLDLIYSEEKNMDALLITGDLSEDGSIESYERLKHLLKKISCPIYAIHGNHDNATNFTHLLNGNIEKTKLVSLGQWEIIFLDTVVPYETWGELSDMELQFLLSRQNKLHKIIAMHHHPYSVGTAIFENIGVKNSNEFWKVANNPCLFARVILCGHVHQDFQAMLNDVCFLSCPSTWLQVKTGSQEQEYEKTFDTLTPGYRWLNLFPNGDFETGIRRIPL